MFSVNVIEVVNEKSQEEKINLIKEYHFELGHANHRTVYNALKQFCQ